VKVTITLSLNTGWPHTPPHPKQQQQPPPRKQHRHFVLEKVYVDALTGNQFVVRQAKGLPTGERSLHLYSPAVLPKDSVLCLYSDPPRILTHHQLRLPYAVATPRELDYAVWWNESSVALPSSLTPQFDVSGACTNLGILVNGCLPGDAVRPTANARLALSHSTMRISIRSNAVIHTGDEIVIAYGPLFGLRKRT
jgi:hypothetical protein